MTNAWVQRLLVLGSFLFWWLLAAWLWPEHRGWSVLCWSMPLLITPVLLGFQCLMAARANRSDPSPQATAGQWWRAWLAEWRVAVVVFTWWQPFRHHALADYVQPTSGRRGMVLVHGFFCNRALWTDWMRKLQREGRAFIAVDLEPAYDSISHYADIVEQAVAKMERATGLPPVLVGHSMGGLAIRAWAAQQGASCLARVQRIITQGTPHHGTLIAHVSHTVNGQEMRVGSRWLADNASRLPDGFAQKCICFYSNCDNIVFPAQTATLSGADNRFLAGRAHVELAFLPEIQQACWAQME
jgi:triacylglycerol lipase